MYLIVGLGNPGKPYENTFHNVGFMAIDEFAKKHGATFSKSECKAKTSHIFVDGEKVILAKPQTYMNLSGEAVIAVMNFYKIQPEDIFVAYDDISLPLGTLRFRAKGSDGGHNGIKSIIKVLGGNNTFDRLKIGIGPQPPVPSEVFVLQNFTKEQLEELKPALQKAADAVEFYLNNGLTLTQSKFNG